MMEQNPFPEERKQREEGRHFHRPFSPFPKFFFHLFPPAYSCSCCYFCSCCRRRPSSSSRSRRSRRSRRGRGRGRRRHSSSSSSSRRRRSRSRRHHRRRSSSSKSKSGSRSSSSRRRRRCSTSFRKHFLEGFCHKLFFHTLSPLRRRGRRISCALQYSTEVRMQETCTDPLADSPWVEWSRPQ